MSTKNFSKCLAILLVLGLTGMTSAATPFVVDTTGSVAGGWLNIDIEGYNYKAGNALLGQQGSFHSFYAQGSFDLDHFNVTMNEPYGALDTEVRAQSHSYAYFNMYGRQDFEVSGGNIGSRLRIGEMNASTWGDEGASMDVHFDGSMYIFADHGPYTYPTTPSPNWMLRAQGANYDVWHSTEVSDKNTGQTIGLTEVNLWQNGGAPTAEGMFGYSNAWAFSTNQGGTNYPSSGTMYMHANGGGNNWQYTEGLNGGTHNGAVFVGAFDQTTSGSFAGSYQFNPSASAN